MNDNAHRESNQESLIRKFTHIVIPAEIWLRNDISIQAKALWAEIFSLHDDQHGGCYASDEYLMTFMQIKRSRLHEVYAELKKVGLLIVVKFNGRQSIRRAIYPETQYVTGRQMSGKPDSRNPENRTSDVRKTGHLPTPSPYIYKSKDKKKDKNICSEPSQSTHTAKPIRAPVPSISFSFSESKFEGITEKDLKTWKELYPSIDIELALKEMTQWILANPTKSKKLWRKFIIGWFKRANDHAVNKQAYKQIGKTQNSPHQEIKSEDNHKWAQQLKTQIILPEDIRFMVSDNCVQLEDKSRRVTQTVGYLEINFKDIVRNFFRNREIL